MNHSIRRTWWATIIFFLVHGLVVGTWVSRIPAVQMALHLNNGTLGLCLLCGAAGAVASIPLAGGLMGRYGSKPVAIVSSVLFCLAVILPGLADNAITLAVGLFLFGATASAMDVSMNAQGVEMEKRLGGPTMSRFHGMYSTGAMTGAALGGVAAAHGLLPPVHFSISGAINLAMILGASPLLVNGREHLDRQQAHSLPLNRIPGVLLAISAITFCILLSEGAMSDWIALYLRQVLAAGAGTAAAGFSAFSGAMAGFRFLGDFITARLGAMRTVRTGALVAATGLILALSMSSPQWAIPGFTIAGAGFSVIIPLAFGSGGRVPSVAPSAGIATVTGIGYVGFIVGPPTIGFASQWITLRYALGIVVGCCLVAAALAGSMKKLEPTPAESYAPQTSEAF